MMVLFTMYVFIDLFLQILHLSTVTVLHLLQELQSRLQVLHQLPFHAHISLCVVRPENQNEQ